MVLSESIRRICDAIGFAAGPSNTEASLSPFIVACARDLLDRPGQLGMYIEMANLAVQDYAEHFSDPSLSANAIEKIKQAASRVAQRKITINDVKESLYYFCAGVQSAHEQFGMSPEKITLFRQVDFGVLAEYMVPKEFYDLMPPSAQQEHISDPEDDLLNLVLSSGDEDTSISLPADFIAFYLIRKEIYGKEKAAKEALRTGFHETFHHYQFSTDEKRTHMVAKLVAEFGEDWPNIYKAHRERDPIEIETAQEIAKASDVIDGAFRKCKISLGR